MAEQFKGDLMERIERLERANFRWRVVGLTAIAGVLLLGGYAVSQKEQQKPQAAPTAGAREFPIDPTPAPVTYTNFVRVSVTPEELILDLALNTQTNPDSNQPIRIANRVVMNFFTAKRLMTALQGVVQQYETTYGPLELDFQKRIIPGAKAPSGK